MNEEQYLKARITDIEKNIHKTMTSTKYQKNQQAALRFYKNALERITCIPKD